MMKTLLLFLAAASVLMISGCSGGDPDPVVGNAPGVSESSKGEESPEVQARTKEKRATQPGSNGAIGRD